MWQPDIVGKYTVKATFAGSSSYGSSWAESAFGVVDTTNTAPSPTVQPISAVEMYFLPSVVAIIIAIAVVGVVIVLLLRKKP
jgi:hypothetical protein